MSASDQNAFTVRFDTLTQQLQYASGLNYVNILTSIVGTALPFGDIIIGNSSNIAIEAPLTTSVNTEIIYNNNGVLAGDSNLIWVTGIASMGIGKLPDSYPLEIDSNRADGTYVLCESSNNAAASGFLATNNLGSVQIAAFNAGAGAPLASTGAIFADGMPLQIISDTGSVSIAAGTTTPQVVVTTGGALALTPLTATQIAALTPSQGWIVMNSTTGHLEYYNGTTWVSL